MAQININFSDSTGGYTSRENQKLHQRILNAYKIFYLVPTICNRKRKPQILRSPLYILYFFL